MDPADKLIEAFKVLIIAAVLIVAAFQIIDSLLSSVPLWIKLVLGSLIVAFVYAARDFVIGTIKKLLKI